MAAGKPSSLNVQSEATAKEQPHSREQLEVKNRKGLEQSPERNTHDLRARNNHDFLKKEAPGEAMDDSVGEQLNHTESHEAMQFLRSGRRSTRLRECAPWENPKAFLGCSEGAVNVHRSSREVSDFSGEAEEEEDTKVEVTKMEDHLEEEEYFLGQNTFTKDIQRTLFREFCYQEAEGPRETCSRLWYLCHRWLKPERHTKEQILELVILEQFLTILPLEIQSWVKRGCPQTCDQAVALAEDFLQRHQEFQELEQEGQVPIREAGLNLCAPEQPPLMKANASCLRTKEEVENEISSHTVVRWITENKKEKPSVQTTESVKLLETSWRSSPWPKEDKECSPNPGESDKRRKTYPTPRVDVFFPYLGESREVNQNIVVKRRRRTKGEKVCGVCGRSFSRTTVLVAHQRTHTGEKPFMCKDCGKCFSLKSTLVAHERTHTGERPYTCSQCGKSFTVSSDLTRHYRIHIGEKPFNCLQCDKSFSRKTQLLNHQKVHTREKPYKCSQCGETFNRSSSLMIHEGSHTGEKPFKCPDCEKSFNTSSQLVKHHRVHTGERPYTCSECGKSFSQRQILMVHQRIHTGEKPFKCATCGKCFCDRAVLIRHQKVHTGERPHECTTCGKSFSHRAVLVRHQKIHTRDALNVQRLEQEETSTSRHIS